MSFSSPIFVHVSSFDVSTPYVKIPYDPIRFSPSPSGDYLKLYNFFHLFEFSLQKVKLGRVLLSTPILEVYYMYPCPYTPTIISPHYILPTTHPLKGRRGYLYLYLFSLLTTRRPFKTQMDRTLPSPGLIESKH